MSSTPTQSQHWLKRLDQMSQIKQSLQPDRHSRDHGTSNQSQTQFVKPRDQNTYLGSRMDNFQKNYRNLLTNMENIKRESQFEQGYSYTTRNERDSKFDRLSVSPSEQSKFTQKTTLSTTSLFKEVPRRMTFIR